MPTFRYAKSQVAVHWLAALLIVFLLVTGTFVLADLPNTAQKIGNLRVHMLLGALTGALVLARIVMRKRLPSGPAVQGEKLAYLGHTALNLGVLLLVASGGVMALQSGAFDAVFGTGVLPDDFKFFTLRKVHGLLSRLAMALIAVHVAAALYHQFVLKDGLIARMTFGKKSV
jgi:cytochrome b561